MDRFVVLGEFFGLNCVAVVVVVDGVVIGVVSIL